jgi:hypothetical protein
MGDRFAVGLQQFFFDLIGVTKRGQPGPNKESLRDIRMGTQAQVAKRDGVLHPCYKEDGGIDDSPRLGLSW